jgi:hypothetical protein
MAHPELKQHVRAPTLGTSKMRWLFMSSIGMVVGFAAPLMAHDQNLEGFQGTNWGMSEKQVQEIFDGKLSHWINTETPSNLFGLRHYDVDGCDFSVDFRFDRDGLSRVGMQLNNDTKIECPGLILETLIGKYGLPSTDRPLIRSDSGSHMRLWYLGNTKIREIDTEARKIGTLPLRSSLSIYYEPTQTAGAKKL